MTVVKQSAFMFLFHALIDSGFALVASNFFVHLVSLAS